LKLKHIKTVKGRMQEAIQNADIVVGCHSTGVLEALLQLKAPIFLHTQKLGDYYSIEKSDGGWNFFAKNPSELIERIKGIHNLPHGLIANMREQYFGDPHKNGSKWVVDQIEQILQKNNKPHVAT